jgi:murein DD-endopeptidase MepM/ murein hydrolase activator NlpD
LATLHAEPSRTTRTRTLTPFRSRLTAPRRALVVAGLLAASLFGTHAATAAPSSITEAQSEHGTAAAEVAGLEARVAEAKDTLERMTVEAEAAGEAARAAQAALAEAQAAAAKAARELATVRAAVAQSQEDVANLGREAYMGSDETFGDVALLLAADSPAELLQQAATLEHLGDQRTQQLAELKDAEVREAQADRAARDAVAEQDRAAQAANAAEAAAAEALTGAQATYDKTAAEKAALDKQLQAAQVQLLASQGVQKPHAAVAEQQATAAAATMLSSAAGAVAPTQGTVTSCYGPRWGTVHSGVDVAAPIGTPVYTPEGGVVLQAGVASGFGYAVAIQHGDGTITLYGHVNQYFVSAGQVVTTGQQIAEVGNRGQSTGPHLHFEVHTDGLYANRVNPTPWLTARGISLGGC